MWSPSTTNEQSPRAPSAGLVDGEDEAHLGDAATTMLRGHL